MRTLWNEKKVPNIPPLLVKNELITEFEAKVNIFNKYLANMTNHLTDDKLSSFNISSEVIFQLIKNLDPNKAHGDDEISVKMLKLCAYSICKPRASLFENCLASGEFPNVWKKIILFQSIKKWINN